MLGFVFLAVLVSVPVSNLSLELGRIPFINLQDARLGNFEELCNWFCRGNDQHAYFFRTFDDVLNPRIFCGLCKKKLSTTTTTASTTSRPSTISSVMPHSSTTNPTPTSSPTAPPTTPPTTTPTSSTTPPTPPPTTTTSTVEPTTTR